MRIEIVTPEKVAYSQEADQITLPTTDGEITVLSGHISLVTNLIPGELRLKEGGQTVVLALGTGFAEIDGKKVIVATDLAERAEEIDERSAEEARKRAQEALKEKERLSEEEFAVAAATLQKALAQLKVKRRHSSRRNPETVP